MAYDDPWGRPRKQEPVGLGERAYRRASLPAWDVKWHALSPAARLAFLDQVKSSKKEPAYSSWRPAPVEKKGVPATKFPPKALEELAAAGFVEVRPAKPGASKSRAANPQADQVFAAKDLDDFLTRIRAVHRYRLPIDGKPVGLGKFLNFSYHNDVFVSMALRILRGVGAEEPYLRVDEALSRYIVNYRWPGLVAASLEDPRAGKILAALREAGGPVNPVELVAKVGGKDPAGARGVLDALITHMAVFEGLDPTTFDLVVGLLPVVREAWTRAEVPRKRPPLVAVETPRDQGPAGSVLVDDLRALLLEVAGEPPRLRQDGNLFQKEIDRFESLFTPLPVWLADSLRWTPEARLKQALTWARALKVTKEEIEGKQISLRLASPGQKWLASSLDDQYLAVYTYLRDPARYQRNYHNAEPPIFAGATNFFGYDHADSLFLGRNVTVLKVEKGQGKAPVPYFRQAKAEDFEALRESLHRAFSDLPIGIFHQLESVLDHAAFGEANPLHLGLAAGEVVVLRDGRPVSAFEEFREELGRLVLDTLIRTRLIPLGCLQAAIDDKGGLCIARQPRLDAYFGVDVPRTELAGSVDVESRVVVQPDFSVIIIGLNPAPAAELAPFCERTTRGMGQGAVVLKITRESVVKAVANGLKPAEIVARLGRHASTEVPANVLREVKDWCAWVRDVSATTLTVLRCPDRDAADRVVAVLKRQAERLNDTLVAFDPAALTTVERKKLRDHGILVRKAKEPGNPVPELVPVPRKSRGRRW